ncbi:type II secretion system protein GspL [Variovorax sp. AFSI2.2]|uniref:type II secretion system protein GspL n=1 Tax=Variovorax sp. AFSI2.2 TaxID=3384160 RepID=UPI003EBC34D8
MSRTLYLYLDAGWPHRHLDCAWSLLDGERSIATGQDAPQRWPQATEHVVILSQEQLVYHRVKLPPGVNWKDTAAVAMALEDALIDDLGRLVVIPLRLHGDDVVCCTLQRQRLEQLLASFRELGRPLVRVESLADKLPAAPDEWRIFQNEDGHLWLHDGVAAMALDMPADCGEPPVALTLRWAQNPGQSPARMVLHGLASTLFLGQERQWGIPVQRTAALDWHTTLSQPSPNLLVGDWMPRRKLLAEPAFRTALVAIAACMAIQTLMALTDLGKTWWSTRQVKAEQSALWQEVGGSAEKTDKPARHLHQMWQAARAHVGESRSEEFVPVLAALAQQLAQARLTSLDYEQGRMIVVWNGTGQNARALEAGMRQRGYTAVTQSANNGVVTTALVSKEGT